MNLPRAISDDDLWVKLYHTAPDAPPWFVGKQKNIYPHPDTAFDTWEEYILFMGTIDWETPIWEQVDRFAKLQEGGVTPRQMKYIETCRQIHAENQLVPAYNFFAWKIHYANKSWQIKSFTTSQVKLTLDILR